MLVSAGLTAAVLMIGVAGIMTLRQSREVTYCQNNMREVHTGLQTFASTSENHLYPRVAETEDVRTTLTRLNRDGTLPAKAASLCPAVDRDKAQHPDLDYAYLLGYRDAKGDLQGNAADNDQFPIFADAPRRLGIETRPINHRKGQNVLFAGGNVRFCTHPFVGPDAGDRGDDIYLNTAKEPHAGTHRLDCVLGAADDKP